MLNWKFTVLALAVLAAVAACSEQERIIKGERIDIRVPLEKTVGMISEDDANTVEYANLLKKNNTPRPIQLADMRRHQVWPQLNGNAAHRIQHPALSKRPSLIWSTPIGNGNSRQHRITGSPIYAAGHIFAMDSQSRVTAVSANGREIWSTSLVPPYERPDDASGGGLAYEAGVIYATTGFGNLYAMRASSGDLIWTQEFEAPASFPPAVSDGLVFLVTLDNQAWAVDTGSGRLRWNWQSTEATASTATGGTPAVSGDLVILPYPSGEVQAANHKSGEIVWAVTVGGARGAAARSALRAISGAPVIDGDTLYVANQAGKMASIDINTGITRWTATEGSSNPAWPEGDSVFVVSDAAELVRLEASSGKRIWSSPLPGDKSSLFQRKKAVYANFGPILAGQRLIVASGDGFIRFFDPVSGKLTASASVSGGAATGPIVASGRMYLVSAQGHLTAYQ